MLCSKCSAIVQPIVALDIDGTLGDWHEAFFTFASTYFGEHYDPRTFEGPGGIARAMGVTQEQYRECKLAFRQSGMKRGMKTFAGTIPLVSYIKAAHIELWITTTRPYLQVGNVDPDTRQWLVRNGIFEDHLLYGDDKYGDLARMVDKDRVLAVVDDEPAMYDRALDVGFNPILIARTHNHKDKRPVMAGDLIVAQHMVAERLHNWRRRYEGHDRSGVG